MKHTTSIGLALCALAGAVMAQDRRPPLVVGPAMVACRTFAESAEAEKQAVVTWAQGFLSGMNTYRWLDTQYRPLGLPDAPSIRLFLDRYCRANPLETPLKGSIELFRHIEDRQ